jgi:hypothetical protein
LFNIIILKNDNDVLFVRFLGFGEDDLHNFRLIVFLDFIQGISTSTYQSHPKKCFRGGGGGVPRFETIPEDGVVRLEHDNKIDPTLGKQITRVEIN